MNKDYTEEIKTILKEHDLKVTPQRKIILNYLLTHRTHPTVEMIQKSLSKKQPNLGIATVYNTLNTFVELGLVIEIQNGDGSTHYDYFAKPHYHIICSNCGRIDDVESSTYIQSERELRRDAEQATGYLTSGSHFEVYGICPSCQKKLHLHLINN